jgi:hypothetical protein
VAKGGTLVIDLNSGADNGAAIPSVAEMISDSVATPEGNSGGTSLDDLHLEFSDARKPPTETVPPKEGAPNAPRRGRPVSGAPKERAIPKRKAEIVSELESVRAELAAERARHDTGSIQQLATSIEMASHLCFGFAAQMRGPHWAINQEEAKSIGDSGAVALAPYADKIATQLPWMVFCATIAKVAYSRVLIDHTLAERLNVQYVNGELNVKAP